MNSDTHRHEVCVGDLVESISKDGTRLKGEIQNIPEPGLAHVHFEDGTERRITFQQF